MERMHHAALPVQTTFEKMSGRNGKPQETYMNQKNKAFEKGHDFFRTGSQTLVTECRVSSCKNLHDAVSASADHPPSILTPDNGTYAFTAHVPMAHEFLGAAPLFQ